MGSKQSFTNSVTNKLRQKYGDDIQTIEVEDRDNSDVESFFQTLREAERNTEDSELIFR